MDHHTGSSRININKRQEATRSQNRIALRQAASGTRQARHIITAYDRERYRRTTTITRFHREDLTDNLTGIQLILCSISRVAPLATAINRKTSITTRHTALGHHTGRRSIQINQH